VARRLTESTLIRDQSSAGVAELVQQLLELLEHSGGPLG